MSIFTKSKKITLPTSTLTAQELIGVDEVNDNLLYTREKIMYAFIKVRADSDALSNPERKIERYEYLTQALEQETEAWQLLSVPHVVDTHGLMRHLLDLKRNTSQHNQLILLDGEISQVQSMAADGIREPMLYLKLWAKEGRDAEDKLNKRIKELVSRLSSLSGFHVTRLINHEIAYLCKQFAELGQPLLDTEATYENPSLGHDDHAVEISLLDEITPVGGITVESNYLYLGGAKARVYGVTGYPRQFSLSWASSILNNTNAITTIIYTPENPNVLADALAKTVSQSMGEMELARDRRTALARQRELVTADALIEQVDGEQKAMGTFVFLTMPFSSDPDRLEQLCGDAIALFRKKRMRLKAAGQLQKEGLQSLLPYSTMPSYIKQQFGRLMPIETFAGGSPFCIETLRDEKGMYFAQTDSGGIVSLDHWVRTADRTNSNWVLFGKPGVGKSTLSKHIIQSEIMQGTRIIIVDPQSEYWDITRHLGGEILNMSGGAATINILEISPPVANNDDFASDSAFEDFISSHEYDKFLSSNTLAVHIKEILGIFRSYFKDASEVEIALLETELIATYKRFGIDWDTDISTLVSTDYPILSDLLVQVNTSLKHDESYKSLQQRLTTMAEGASRFMFNGHTNIDMKSQIVCLDTMELQKMDGNVKSAQFLNILQYAWREICRDRSEKVMLIIDEAYTMVDANHPIPLRLLRDISKQCRKFSGALGFISHDIIDVMHESIRQYSQAILSIATYKYFMGTDGKNLKETQDMFDLTDEEVEVLRKGIRGDIIALIGASVHYLKAEIPQYKLDNMGTAGGE